MCMKTRVAGERLKYLAWLTERRELRVVWVRLHTAPVAPLLSHGDPAAGVERPADNQQRREQCACSRRSVRLAGGGIDVLLWVLCRDPLLRKDLSGSYGGMRRGERTLARAYLGVGAAVAVFAVGPLEVRAVVAHGLTYSRAVRRSAGGDGHLRELQAVAHGLGDAQVEIVLPDTLISLRSARRLGGGAPVAAGADA